MFIIFILLPSRFSKQLRLYESLQNESMIEHDLP